MDGLYIGLMSGTSLDAIDAALVEFSQGKCELVRHNSTQILPKLKREILTVCNENTVSLDSMCEIDSLLGQQFAQAAAQLIQPGDKVIAIGSHGQTIAHYPQGPQGNSLQIGDANRIVARTGITTVTDFRRADIAAGGQGAPLASAFHAAFMASDTDRYVVNIGGMSNLTHLKASKVIQGFDLGPGNVLMDTWIKKIRGYDYDACGDWARTGKVDEALLNTLLKLPYIHEAAPKSTGREVFNEQLLETLLKDSQLDNADVQATLTEFTAACISNALVNKPAGQILICGGGVHNQLLMERIQLRTKRLTLSSERIGIDPDFVEAMAFAWFAKATLSQTSLQLAHSTGAAHNVISGAIYPATNLRLNFHES